MRITTKKNKPTIYGCLAGLISVMTFCNSSWASPLSVTCKSALDEHGITYKFRFAIGKQNNTAKGELKAYFTSGQSENVNEKTIDNSKMTARFLSDKAKLVIKDNNSKAQSLALKTSKIVAIESSNPDFNLYKANATLYSSRLGESLAMKCKIKEELIATILPGE